MLRLRNTSVGLRVCKSQLNPFDPFVDWLRSSPVSARVTLFESKTGSLYNEGGKVIPVTVETSFYFVNRQVHMTNDAGKGRRVDGAYDTESETSPFPQKCGMKRTRPNTAASTSGEIVEQNHL
jgi:hypothetical protein